MLADRGRLRKRRRVEYEKKMWRMRGRERKPRQGD